MLHDEGRQEGRGGEGRKPEDEAPNDAAVVARGGRKRSNRRTDG